MDAYVQYDGEKVKIGTKERLYYVSYNKFVTAVWFGKLSAAENSLPPFQYRAADSGFIFRFPFPDEDHLEFGKIGRNSFDRTLPLYLEGASLPTGLLQRLQHKSWHHPEGRIRLDVIGQTRIYLPGRQTCLALVLSDPEDGETWVEDKSSHVRFLLQLIEQNHYWEEGTMNGAWFWQTVSDRIRIGYGLQEASPKK